MRGYFKNSPALLQLCILFIVCICSLCLALFFDQVYLKIFPYNLRISLFIQNSLPLFMTALGTQYLISGSSFVKSFSLQRPGWILVFIGILTFIASGPFIEMLSNWNQQLSLPDSMKAFEAWMVNSEKQVAELTGKLLNTTTIGGFALNILQIAIFAGLCEELLFRGVIQKIMIRWTGNMHVGIWIAAAIFSAIHLQFFGFIPRMVLGAMLGYLFALSGTLWIPIIAHIANNALVIITSKVTGNSEITSPLNYSENPLWLSLASFILICLGLYLTWKIGVKKKQSFSRRSE